MKRTEPQTIGEILRSAIAASNLSDNFSRQRAAAAWPDIVGPEIARLTMRRRLEGSELHVYVSSAPLKNELSFNRARLLDLLNEAAGSRALTALHIH